jgi:hypothetical protein
MTPMNCPAFLAILVSAMGAAAEQTVAEIASGFLPQFV